MTTYTKYPRTKHLPWSPGITSDDQIMDDVSIFEGKNIVMTEKMDGENTTMYHDHVHARSINSGYHPSRTWIKGLWATVRHKIPVGWRICGENVFAQHSITYTQLQSYFLGFSVWTDENQCLSWADTLRIFEDVGIVPVPILYEGVYNRDKIVTKWSAMNENDHEGYVIRLASSFDYEDFGRYVGKYVRESHVQTDDHWMNQPVIPNGVIK
jgi:hypothetical protein